MIPPNIRREHILQAIGEIDERPVPQRLPPRRQSTRHDILYQGRRYPPKYTVGLANRFANGVELEHTDFYGGDEVNQFLRKRRFQIVPKPHLQ